jgi:hypothetical protein
VTKAVPDGYTLVMTASTHVTNAALQNPEKGSMYTRTTIEIVERLNLSPGERHAIYEGNARRLLKL